MKPTGKPTISLSHRVTAFVLAGTLVSGWAAIAPDRVHARAMGSDTELANKQAQAGPRLSGSVARAVRRHLSRFLNVPRREITVTDYSRETWSNGCLGLPSPNELCHQALVNGWRVVVSHGQQTWTYRTDRRGRRIRLETQGNSMTAINLPDAVFNAVVQNAQERSQSSASNVRVLWATQREWSDSCLGLPNPTEACATVITLGWLVGVDVGRRVWRYRTDNSGNTVRLEGSQTGSTSLPVSVSQAILRNVRRQSGDAGRVIYFEPREWSNGCLDLPQIGEFCTQEIVSGWYVIVENDGGQRWIYHTDQDGSRLRQE